MNVEWISKEQVMEIADRVSANPDILEPHVTKEDLEALDITIDIIRPIRAIRVPHQQ